MFFARGSIFVGILSSIVFVLYGMSVVIQESWSQKIPLESWLEAFAILAAIFGAIALFMWAIKCVDKGS